MDDSWQRLTHAASSFERYRMITTLFLGFVALMAAVVVALSARYLTAEPLSSSQLGWRSHGDLGGGVARRS